MFERNTPYYCKTDDPHSFDNLFHLCNLTIEALNKLAENASPQDAEVEASRYCVSMVKSITRAAMNLRQTIDKETFTSLLQTYQSFNELEKSYQQSREKALSPKRTITSPIPTTIVVYLDKVDEKQKLKEKEATAKALLKAEEIEQRKHQKQSPAADKENKSSQQGGAMVEKEIADLLSANPTPQKTTPPP